MASGGAPPLKECMPLTIGSAIKFFLILGKTLKVYSNSIRYSVQDIAGTNNLDLFNLEVVLFQLFFSRASTPTSKRSLTPPSTRPSSTGRT
jgi:hypothetical protein